MVNISTIYSIYQVNGAFLAKFQGKLYLAAKIFYALWFFDHKGNDVYRSNSYCTVNSQAGLKKAIEEGLN